ncbi:MAG: hypothetical protein ACYS8X_10360 [Planctomycetota bacterium]
MNVSRIKFAVVLVVALCALGVSFAFAQSKLTGTIISCKAVDGELTVEGKVVDAADKDASAYLVLEVTEEGKIIVADELEVEGKFEEVFYYGGYEGAAYAVVLYTERIEQPAEDEDEDPVVKYAGELARHKGKLPTEEDLPEDE